MSCAKLNKNLLILFFHSSCSVHWHKLARNEEHLKRKLSAGEDYTPSIVREGNEKKKSALRKDSAGRKDSTGRNESARRKESSVRKDRSGREENVVRKESAGKRESVGWMETVSKGKASDGTKSMYVTAQVCRVQYQYKIHSSITKHYYAANNTYYTHTTPQQS